MSSLNVSLVGPGGLAWGTPPKRYPVVPTTVNECPDRLVGTCVFLSHIERSNERPKWDARQNIPTIHPVKVSISMGHNEYSIFISVAITPGSFYSSLGKSTSRLRNTMHYSVDLKTDIHSLFVLLSSPVTSRLFFFKHTLQQMQHFILTSPMHFGLSHRMTGCACCRIRTGDQGRRILEM